jgi:type I restriction enzyme S subunit
MGSSKHNELPSGWKMKKVGELSKTSAGGTPSTNRPEFWGGDIKWMSSGDLNLRKVYDVAGRITQEGLNSSSTKLFPPYCILIGLAGQGKTRGTVAMNMVELCANQSVAAIYPSEQINEHYLFYNLESRYDELRQLSTGDGGRGGLNLALINSLKIPIPPLPEQRAIANILSTWDNAIQTTKALISQKETEKKWLMQNLLTGKKRLKGFSGDWEEMHIREFAKEVSIKNKSDKQLTVLSCTKHNGLVPSLEYFGRKIFADDVSTYKIVPLNHFAYATNHIEEGSIGYQEKFDEALISPMYTVFKTNESVNDTFMFRLLKSHPLIYQYQNRMEGSIDRRGGLRWDAFSIIKIKLPSLEEQSAIARVLQTADKEIELLKTKLEQQKLQKKGLMQVLLTGKVRVKTEIN